MLQSKLKAECGNAKLLLAGYFVISDIPYSLEYIGLVSLHRPTVLSWAIDVFTERDMLLAFNISLYQCRLFSFHRFNFTFIQFFKFN